MPDKFDPHFKPLGALEEWRTVVGGVISPSDENAFLQGYARGYAHVHDVLGAFDDIHLVEGISPLVNAAGDRVAFQINAHDLPTLFLDALECCELTETADGQYLSHVRWLQKGSRRICYFAPLRKET